MTCQAACQTEETLMTNPKLLVLPVALALVPTHAQGQADSAYAGPIIDMHMHVSSYYLELGRDGTPLPFDCHPAPCDGVVTAATDEEDVLRMTIEAMERHNVVLGFLTGDSLERLDNWTAAAPGRFIPSPRIGPPGVPGLENLRKEYGARRLAGMGEIATQYDGYAANDPAIAPYFALAEEVDVPTLIHSAGIGAPTPQFRVSNGDPRFLEDALVAHPELRLYAENCGFPFATEMIAMMYQYPQLYCDVSTITWVIPSQAFMDYLEQLVRAGLSKRIMFGSDQMLLPETIGMAIDAIQAAEFLTVEQKADIFYNNAARFLRLGEEEIAKHHAR
jgi:predicted TIM-barrel fold metal-dependent hydrolase